MHNVWGSVEYLAKAVAAIVAHDGIALFFSVCLNGVANIADSVAWFYLGYAEHHGVVGYLRQALGFDRRFASPIHTAGVAMPTIDNDGDVDIDDIAVFEPERAGDAMADDMVDRGADGFGEPAIT